MTSSIVDSSEQDTASYSATGSPHGNPNGVGSADTMRLSDFENVDARLLPGFMRRHVRVDERPVLALIGGAGPPLLMLHGDPQTHLCWHAIAPALSEHFTVVLSDLRGRGESHQPPASTVIERNAYTKRAMANEQLGLMRALGFERFSLVGHDRGARVARRLALDHPDTLDALVVMDIVPAIDLYEHVNAALAQDYFWFFFLTQPHPQPERLIAGDARGFMRTILTGLSTGQEFFDADALELYLSTASTAESITAMCECFRAGYTIDCEHDRLDRDKGRRIVCPTLVLWGEHGVVGRHFDVPAIWRRWCDDLQVASIPCGHFIPEESPVAALAALSDFFGVRGRSST